MSETLAPLVLLLGDDVLARKDAEDAWSKRVFGDANPSFNLAVLSAADGAERAIEVAKTMPMMAPHRLVVIRDIDEAPVALLDDLMAYAERPNPSTTLLLTGRKLPPAQGGVEHEGLLGSHGELKKGTLKPRLQRREDEGQGISWE